MTRSLGLLGEVGPVGLGALPLSTPGLDEADAIAVVHAALDAGVTLIDTADAYAPDHARMGHNERLVARALAAYPDPAIRARVVVATKGGFMREPHGWRLDGRPERLREAIEESRRALGRETLDLWQLHRPDPAVPFDAHLEAMAGFVERGWTRALGLSNATAEQASRAIAVLGRSLASVQNEYSPAYRLAPEVIDLCQQQGRAFLPWSPLGGMRGAHGLGTSIPEFAGVALARGVSPQAVAVAWLLTTSECVIPIPGASRPASIRDSAAAASLRLTAEEMAMLDATEPVNRSAMAP